MLRTTAAADGSTVVAQDAGDCLDDTEQGRQLGQPVMEAVRLAATEGATAVATAVAAAWSATGVQESVTTSTEPVTRV
jgi:hypothetical protein